MGEDASEDRPEPDDAPARSLSVRQAAFIGVGSMVGAGIFALLGSAGEVAGAAVWVSFLLAGIVAALAEVLKPNVAAAPVVVPFDIPASRPCT